MRAAAAGGVRKSRYPIASSTIASKKICDNITENGATVKRRAHKVHTVVFSTCCGIAGGDMFIPRAADSAL